LFLLEKIEGKNRAKNNADKVPQCGTRLVGLAWVLLI